MTLEIEDLAVAYDGSPVLDGVSLSVGPDSIHALLGPNGVGKTTLLRAATGLLEPDHGQVLIEGTPIKELSSPERAGKIAYVPQSESPTFATSVFQAVLLGRTPHTSWRPSREDRDRVGAVLSQLGLADYATRPTDTLSQGQRRKVAIARLLVQEPAMMVLDEPTASLDLRHRLDVLEIIENQTRDRSVGTLLAMHDIELAARFADTVTILADGQVFDSGTPESVLTAEAIESVYGVSATVDRHDGRLHVDAQGSRRVS
ncbi:ABC transporter ATP-binding protein [Halodesulfurarchaeum sp. HSR-GB]|uniref:ABC transporter ATP-binding protein n=1 Tax=Halodesulfurarchaeum sp. HSR-GB TaxID=3074077 RepID=UPI0028610388|nr:ABC transporter ATP-binding protein [Halodesulfurarchaeum sp. HSR-GB]MDR5657582.1 ABC transporter ATP-binding protein [Halodesulfurarchaeum sp. HSR-GB]